MRNGNIQNPHQDSAITEDEHQQANSLSASVEQKQPGALKETDVLKQKLAEIMTFINSDNFQSPTKKGEITKKISQVHSLIYTETML